MENLQEQERQIRDLQASNYELVRRRAYFKWFEISEKQVVRWLLKDLTSGWLLDAACSTGRITKYLQKISPKLVSVDFSFGSLKEAARKNPDANYIQADLAALPFKPIFTSIICLDALHCIPPAKRKEAVRTCSEVLLPEGMIIASIWNKRSFSRIFELPTEGKFQSGIYYQAMTEEKIIELFSQNGFKKVKINGLGFMLYLIRSIRFTSTIYELIGWITIPLEQLLSRFITGEIKHLAMYYVIKAGK